MRNDVGRYCCYNIRRVVRGEGVEGVDVMTISKPMVLKGQCGAVIEVGIGVGLKETSNGFLSGKFGAMSVSGCSVGRSVSQT